MPSSLPFTVPPFLRRYGIMLALGALLLGAFGTYAWYRQRYIGAVDWYGYYQQSLLFKDGRTTLPTEFPVQEFPAQVPLGFAVVNGEAVPQYPPGFPLLLALAGFLKLEFLLTPAIGALSCWLVFLLIRDLTQEKETALLYALLWAFFPIVVYGATQLMSDLVAATFILGSYLCYRRAALFWSAALLAYALAVRPTNVLYLALFSSVLLRDRRLIRYGIFVALAGIPYAIYNTLHYGAPWRTGYFDIRGDLTSDVFLPHLGFYLWQIFLQAGPLVLVLALIGWRRARDTRWFYAGWLLAFFLFFCFWRSGGDRWWWTRFLLPGFAPLFFLSAFGFKEIRQRLASGEGAWRRYAQVALLVLMLITPIYYVRFGLYQRDLWSKNKGLTYYQVVRETEQLVPAGSYVGSVEFAGSFRLYTQLGSFLSVSENCRQFVPHLMQHDRAAYLIVEPWNQTNAVVMELLQRYSATKVKEFNIWGGVSLYRLQRPAQP